MIPGVPKKAFPGAVGPIGGSEELLTMLFKPLAPLNGAAEFVYRFTSHSQSAPIHSHKHPGPMTIEENARDALEALSWTREDALLAAKSAAQTIIDDSQDSDTPLSGMVYDVWGLYNEGTPKCRWTKPYEDDDLVFSGQFRVTESDAMVVRRKVFTPEELQGMIDEAAV